MYNTCHAGMFNRTVSTVSTISGGRGPAAAIPLLAPCAFLPLLFGLQAEVPLLFLLFLFWRGLGQLDALL
jgi:hypothetical protein